MTVPIIVFSFFMGANLFAFLVLTVTKRRARKKFRRSQQIRKALEQAVFQNKTDDLAKLIDRYPLESLLLWRDLQSAITFSPDEVRPVGELFRTSGIEGNLLRMLRSRRPGKRYRAAQLIRPVVSRDNVFFICSALKKEKREYIKLVLVKALIHSGDPDGFDGIADSIESCSIKYLNSIQAMFTSADQRFLDWAKARTERPELMFKISILSGSRVHITPWLEKYVEAHLEHDDPRVRNTAVQTAITSYPYLLTKKLESKDTDIVTYRAGIQSLPYITYPVNLELFRNYFSDPAVQDVAVSAMKTYISLHPDEIENILNALDEETDAAVAEGIARSLIGRLPFLLTTGRTDDSVSAILQTAVKSGESAGLLAFLNQNSNPDIGQWVAARIKPYLKSEPKFRRECAGYLNGELQRELQINPEERPKSSRKIPLTKGDRAALFCILILIAAVPAAGCMYALSGATIGLLSILAREVFRLFTYWFAFYASVLNLIYIFLIFFARNNLNRQMMYWQFTDREYLFTPGILPTVSILAPAYNEEKTAIESVHSLLTLEYPEYQVIVVNDGSSDATIDVLISEFELERVDPKQTGSISTAPVNAVYRSAKFTKLLVIDKENGGKADALNTGINFAENDYICSIDSDSLLEPDALLRMTTRIITTDTETIAVGGNILPVNGCTVARGMLQTIRIPGKSIPRLQTIEYLRSFIAGRMGWSHLNALLIISGAFGLFRRQRVLEIGGYMTGRGEYQRDTVGEDMELVVRLVRKMKDTKNRYLIQYAASANCWTEVPEDLSSLYKQRDRWHRGLVEIMTYHRKMLFNPRYGSAGLIAFPYFLMFEFIGPFYEFAGYPLMIIGFLTGALHPAIFVVMFSAVLLFGMLISMISLVLSEKDVVYFHRKELATLLLYTVIENFGFRQLMGWVRVFSFTGMLFKSKGWQKLERKGFKTA